MKNWMKDGVREERRAAREIKREIKRMLREQAKLLAKPMEKRTVEARPPLESRRAKRYRRWRDSLMGKFGAASGVRHIDSKTGEVITR